MPTTCLAAGLILERIAGLQSLEWKSQMFRQPRIPNEKHLAFIRTLPCLVCQDNISTEACHIRFSDLSVAKRKVGVAEKPDDFWTVPMCGDHHRRQHTMNEQRFWQEIDVDPIRTALALFAISGDFERGCEVVMNAGLTKPINIMAAG